MHLFCGLKNTLLCCRTIPPPRFLIATSMQIFAYTEWAKLTTNRVRAIQDILRLKWRINRIPDPNAANYRLFLARAKAAECFSSWRECDEHFTWHLKNNQSRLETLFWDAFRREIARVTHDIVLSIAVVLTRYELLRFLTFTKKVLRSRPQSSNQFSRFSPFPGEPENSSKHEFEQANISLAKQELY